MSVSSVQHQSNTGVARENVQETILHKIPTEIIKLIFFCLDTYSLRVCSSGELKGDIQAISLSTLNEIYFEKLKELISFAKSKLALENHDFKKKQEDKEKELEEGSGETNPYNYKIEAVASLLLDLPDNRNDFSIALQVGKTWAKFGLVSKCIEIEKNIGIRPSWPLLQVFSGELLRNGFFDEALKVANIIPEKYFKDIACDNVHIARIEYFDDGSNYEKALKECKKLSHESKDKARLKLNLLNQLVRYHEGQGNKMQANQTRAIIIATEFFGGIVDAFISGVQY